MRIEQFVRAHGAALARQGSVQASYRHGYGPYFRLVCRENGRQRTCYIGNDPRKVEAVREMLAKLQRPRVLALLHRQIEQDIRRRLRHAKRQLAADLRTVGLYFKGYEVRGWRTAFGREPHRLEDTCGEDANDCQ